MQVERAEDRPFASLMAGLPMPGDHSAHSNPSDTSREGGGEGAQRSGSEASGGEEEEGGEGQEEEEGASSSSPATSDFDMLPPLVSRLCCLPLVSRLCCVLLGELWC